MSYKPDPGFGTLFTNDRERGPDFKGYILLPSGEVVGIAGWSKKGGMISLKVDGREGDYQAKKLGVRNAFPDQGDQRQARRDDTPVMDRGREDRRPIDDDFDDLDEIPF